jgi:hypothetical protein
VQRASAHQLPPEGDPKLRRERFCRHIDLPHDGTCSDRVHAFIAHYMDRAEAARAMAASTPKVA